MQDKAKNYQLKITLKSSSPAIWRRVVVPGDYNFYDLHDVIQIAMGWQDEHLFQFIVDDKTITDTEMIEDGDVIDAQEVLLEELLEEEGMRFTYEYDFGDGWEHLLLVEQISFSDEPLECPICLAGERSGPPENSGGVWGYQEMLEILADPDHEMYDETSDWIGEEFDPELFDLDDVNEELRLMEMSDEDEDEDEDEE
jgi:hypothetical protein